MTFGEAIREARRVLGVSQKDLAAQLKKEDGTPISPQYLNDIELDRRLAPGYLIEQLAKRLKLEGDYLYVLAGQFPADVRAGRYRPESVQAALRAFRKNLK
jgi:transcriptional regulator with XRE-family HTH domain